MNALAPVVEQVRMVVERRGLAEADVARMAGVDPKTVHRLLTGKTCGRSTLEKVCVALGVQLDLAALVEARVLARVRQHVRQDRTERDNVRQDAAQAVCGWDQAAQSLGIHRRTLERKRRAAGDTTAFPWWRDREALLRWFERLVGGLSEA